MIFSSHFLIVLSYSFLNLAPSLEKFQMECRQIWPYRQLLFTFSAIKEVTTDLSNIQPLIFDISFLVEVVGKKRLWYIELCDRVQIYSIHTLT